MNSYDERERQAYHEAGHAVVSHALGLSVKRVWLHPRGGTAEHEPPRNHWIAEGADPVHAAECWACVHMAGIFAEQEWRKDVVAFSDDDRLGFLDCVMLIEKLTGEDRKDCTARLQERVKSIVDRQWVAIEVLAQELFRTRRDIPGTDAVEIIKTALSSRRGWLRRDPAVAVLQRWAASEPLIEKLWIYGSYVRRDKESPRDIDIAYLPTAEFPSPEDGDALFKLERRWRQHLDEICFPPPPHLQCYGNLNVREGVDDDGELIYEHSPKV